MANPEFVPGPGTYKEPSYTPKAISWKDLSEREILKKKKESKLGPGVYEKKPAFGNEGLKVNLNYNILVHCRR